MVEDFPDLPEDVADEFLDYRAAKAPMTPTAWKRMSAEIRKSGMSAEDCLAETMARGWRGFRAEWVKPSDARGASQGEGQTWS
jgi:hypothetical protein